MDQGGLFKQFSQEACGFPRCIIAFRRLL